MSRATHYSDNGHTTLCCGSLNMRRFVTATDWSKVTCKKCRLHERSPYSAGIVAAKLKEAAILRTPQEVKAILGHDTRMGSITLADGRYVWDESRNAWRKLGTVKS